MIKKLIDLIDEALEECDKIQKEEPMITIPSGLGYPIKIKMNGKVNCEKCGNEKSPYWLCHCERKS